MFNVSSTLHATAYSQICYLCFFCVPQYLCLFSFLSDDTHDDDIIFEDFARLRLKGGETEA